MEPMVIPKHPFGVRAVLTVLLIAAGAFFMGVGIFASQASVLRCAAQQCSRISTYPFGISFDEPIPPVVRAAIRLKYGHTGSSTRQARQTKPTLNLTLYHDDTAAMEFPGVGNGGERAAAVAESINAYLLAPDGEKVFELRSGSIPVGAGLFTLGLIALLMLPMAHASIRMTPLGDTVEVRVGNWPRNIVRTILISNLPTTPLADQFTNDDERYNLTLKMDGEPGLRLSIARRNRPSAIALAQEIDSNFERWRTIQDIRND